MGELVGQRDDWSEVYSNYSYREGLDQVVENPRLGSLDSRSMSDTLPFVRALVLVGFENAVEPHTLAACREAVCDLVDPH